MSNFLLMAFHHYAKRANALNECTRFHDNNFGQCTGGGGKMPKERNYGKDHYTGREESPKAGSAYFFRRTCSPLPIDDTSQINSLRMDCTKI
mmetsp:Transcript_61/g.127  ORF Transcript_61/g.127 Transcript_61/m.127 type:complete len:92 (+) Transcript_61:311-586(+)